MSASPAARQAAQSQAQCIPTKRVLLSDPSQLPSDYSSTPGGTLYSTTPGGTRIVYDRSMLLHLKTSPLAQTPPKNHVAFPASMVKGSDSVEQPKVNGHVLTSPAKKDNVDDSQFEMDM